MSKAEAVAIIKKNNGDVAKHEDEALRALQAFDKIDADKNGSLTFNELLGAVHHARKQNNESCDQESVLKATHNIMSLGDADSSGSLSREEFVVSFLGLGHLDLIMFAFKGIDKDEDGRITPDELVAFLQADKVKGVNLQWAQKEIASMDKDHDGTVSVKEFAQLYARDCALK